MNFNSALNDSVNIVNEQPYLTYGNFCNKITIELPKPKMKKVIFHPPATIILWEDKTKTVVKCDERDTYDKMKGVALCYMKKALGNTSGEFNKALRNAGVYEADEKEEQDHD